MKKLLILSFFTMLIFANCDKGMTNKTADKNDDKISYQEVAENRYSVTLTRLDTNGIIEKTVLDTVSSDVMPKNQVVFSGKSKGNWKIKRHINPSFMCYNDTLAFGFFPSDQSEYFRTYASISWTIRNFFLANSTPRYKDYSFCSASKHADTKVCLYVIYDRLATTNRVDMYLGVEARINGNMMYRFYTSYDIKVDKLVEAKAFFINRMLPIFKVSNTLCKVPIQAGSLKFLKKN